MTSSKEDARADTALVEQLEQLSISSSTAQPPVSLPTPVAADQNRPQSGAGRRARTRAHTDSTDGNGSSHMHRSRPRQSLKPKRNAEQRQLPLDLRTPAFAPVNLKSQQQLESVSANLISRSIFAKHANDRFARRTRPSEQTTVGSPASVSTKKGKQGKPGKQAKQLAAKGNAAPTGPAEVATALKTAKKSSPKHAVEKLFLMERPVPNPQYLIQASQKPVEMDISRPLLVVLDLNGTLLFRARHRGGGAFITRPHLHEFLDYLFSNHSVMVWSSARPENVDRMCAKLFTPEQRRRLVAVWGRDKLGLTPEMYDLKVQVYKQLSWLWSDPATRGAGPWSQRDTVLIDDSVEKAASEPHNLVQISEFDGRVTEVDHRVLAELAAYLDVLRSQQDVSAYIASSPFGYVG